MALSKPKRPSWNIKGPFLAEKGLLNPRKLFFYSRKKGLFQRPNDIFREKSLFGAQGPFRSKTSSFRDKKGHFGAKGSLVELKEGKGLSEQTNSISDPKWAHWRRKMILWKQKRHFQSQKDIFGVDRFPLGPKRKGGPKEPVVPKRARLAFGC